MADSAEHGVVDAFGRVFDRGSGGVHPGLYVADGSAIPTALGVNPSLTIAAVALRTAHHIVAELQAGGLAGPGQAPVTEAATPADDQH